MKTYDEVLKELEREIKMRLRVYPDWLNRGRISQKDADHRLECMQEAYKILTENRPKTFRNGQIIMDFTVKKES